MLTKEQIRKNLKENPYWEPDEKDPQNVWNLYYEVYQDMVDNDEIEIEHELDDELLETDEIEEKQNKKLSE